MFRIFFLVIAVILAGAKDWEHYTGQNEVRDVDSTESGTLWAAFVWGLQERLKNKTAEHPSETRRRFLAGFENSLGILTFFCDQPSKCRSASSTWQTQRL